MEFSIYDVDAAPTDEIDPESVYVITAKKLLGHVKLPASPSEIDVVDAFKKIGLMRPSAHESKIEVEKRDEGEYLVSTLIGRPLYLLCSP